jgi:hypothetical protein
MIPFQAIAAAIGLCIFSATAAPPSPSYSREIDRTKRALESTLKDGSSVQYRNARVVVKMTGEYAGSRTVCVEFNAKNSFGGYVGFKTVTAPLDDPANVFVVDSLEVLRCRSDEEDVAIEHTGQARKDELRRSRRELIEQNCADKRKQIQEAGGADVQARFDELANSCAQLIKKSDAN